MEKFMQREENDVFIGYGNSPKAQSSDDMNFNDVFGGPPRRFSMQEVRVRYSFGETSDGPEEEKASSSPWSSITEKPVFGEETGPRRRHQGGDFFDDIFRGSSESYSSPRRSDNNVFGSSPGSRAISPAKPLPPSVEPFGTSLPTQFSLPAKLTKSIELPTFGSNNQGHRHTDPTTNALNSPHSSTSPLSRFSNQAIKGQDKTRNELHRQSPLSRQPSVSSQDSPITATFDTKDDTNNLEKEYSKNADSFDNQFHFSIYKWAGQGAPMILLPLVAERNLKPKGNKNNYENKTPPVVKKGLSGTLAESLKIERENEAVYEIPEPISRRSSNDINVVHEKEVHLKKEKSLENERKPLRALLGDEDEQPENTPEIKARNPKGVNANAHDSKNAKKNGRKNDSKSANVEKSVLQDEDVSSGVISRKSVAKGKVKEFVQIFNQEVDSRPKPEFRRRSQSCRWTNESEVSSNADKEKEKEKVNLHNEDKKSDVPVKVDENLNNDEPREHLSNHVATNIKKTFSSETIHRDSKISVEIFDDPLEDNFVVQVLSDEHEKVAQDENSEDTKVRRARAGLARFDSSFENQTICEDIGIVLWSLVLWTGSGWKPVPLVDLIEANAVKRAYQKALLRLHPDKLQQKGADFHHKYIAEKVFDILQEAWDHFNTCSSLNL
ncbi:j domain-containing protein required for chloroplast accumulation response 1 [Phtheirospermum japonicum]|uniref:J domain-containing protein required for chloroplast accumulation response 1 n=1 Tax=Phtheirospermum japonicum TaxID=374723 RepID=A0A830C6F9_9LAMI|nr:j domain-containing protein required for chloroplast accumulation response 1 [Phtheirospermum japonicum]